MNDPLWYKNAILYELHVRAFCDANGDGIGDFEGLIQRLDYLQNLGITALWLLPFYPSPLKDDGYDISDYKEIHPIYGTLADFKRFLKEAHRRGLRVMTELVLNHTSDQHPWFQRARQAKPGSAERDFYIWNATPDKYSQARIIFKDFENSNWTWDPVAKAYFWHRFYSHQPDLNYDNPSVREAILDVADFWLDLGVDGLRLDAVPYLYEREGTPCENLPEGHAFLKKFRRQMDRKFKDRVLLAEANQWPEDARAYFGDGDECHMAFHFPLMPRLFMAIRMEDRFPIVDILQQTPGIPANSQWALFLRNHDELTLEMVTDEDRDYMVSVYAQDREARINLGIRRRLAPLLGNNRRKIELMNGLLFSLPGSPVLYYGDEIGMGDNIRLRDRNGVRTPMQWGPGKNAGFSSSPARQLYQPVVTDPEYHYEAVNVQVQEKNLHSLLWQTRRMVALRKQYKAFGCGTMDLLHPENGKILAFVRQHEVEKILVVANLSRFVQHVELDLSNWKGLTPMELFGATKFPMIGESPYFLTLGPHSFYWFSLEPQRTVPEAGGEQEPSLPMLRVQRQWGDLLRGRERRSLEEILPAYLKRQRWFGGKGRRIRTARIGNAIPLPVGTARAYLTFVEVNYVEGEPEVYLLPLAFQARRFAKVKLSEMPYGTLAQVRSADGGAESDGILFDALGDRTFCRSVLAILARRRRLKLETGEVLAQSNSLLRKSRAPSQRTLKPSLVMSEQSNTSVVYGDQWILKVYRSIGEGVNPELEIGRFLSERTTFAHCPSLAGSLEYCPDGGEPITLAVLQRFVPNEGDAWTFTLDVLGRYFETVLARAPKKGEPHLPTGSLLELAQGEAPDFAREVIAPYLDSARTLGERTAQLHLALSSDSKDPSFAPQPFTELYQRSIYQLMRSASVRAFHLLRRQQPALPEEIGEEAKRVLQQEKLVLQIFETLLHQRINALRIRCHGDYHLGQLLYTGKDFVIIDFEGEPGRPLGERRIKRSPLKDVAGMLRSFHYAAYAALFARDAGNPVRPEDQVRLLSWARFWRFWVSATFLKSYLAIASQGSFLPKEPVELRLLLRAYLLEKALYELQYEINNRPDWVKIPLRGILHLLEEKS